MSVLLGALLLWFLLYVIFHIYKSITTNSRSNEELNINNNRIEIYENMVTPHLPILARKHFQLIIRDDYGNINTDRFVNEIKYFCKKTLMIHHNDEMYFEIQQRIIQMTSNYIIENPEILSEENIFSENMTPIEYETFCKNTLEKYSWSAKLTKNTGDQGVDIIAEKNGAVVAIQCKLYNSPVGNKAVQEVYAAQRHIGANFSAVVTNNNYTKSARELANTTGVLLLHHTELSNLHEKLTISSDYLSFPDKVESILQSKNTRQLVGTGDIFIGKDIPDEIKKTIIIYIENKNIENHALKYSETSNEIESYNKIQSFDFNNIPQPAINVILENSKGFSDGSFFSQLKKIESDYNAYLKIESMKNSNIFVDSLREWYEYVIKIWPKDYFVQLRLIEDEYTNKYLNQSSSLETKDNNSSNKKYTIKDNDNSIKLICYYCKSEFTVNITDLPRRHEKSKESLCPKCSLNNIIIIDEEGYICTKCKKQFDTVEDHLMHSKNCS